MSATSNSVPRSFSRFRIEPLDPNSADDIDSAIRVLERAFNGDASEFQRAYYNVPYPPAAERSKSYTKRLVYGLKNGKQAWKVVRNEPGTAEHGVAVGLSVWQPPGIRYRTFESTDKASLSPELRDMYEPVDLEGWNGVYGIMQVKRDELHQGKEHWYLEIFAIDPAYHRQGLGQLLLQNRLDNIPSHLAVQLESSPEGQALYRKVGFEEVLRYDIRGRERGLEVPVMIRKPRA